MNNDLISREALRKAIEEVQDNYDGYEPNDLGKFMNKVYDLIDNAPPVDIKDEIAGAYNEGYMCGNKEAEKARPQGEWIIIKSPLSNETIVKCDKCGDEFIGNDVEDYNFCPNCGADMKGGAK